MRLKSHARYTTLLLIALLTTVPPAAEAQTSREFAEMGVAMWVGFECSALAAIFNDEAENARLFSYAYAEGQAFIAAMQAQKIDQEHISTVVPSGALMLLGGPTPDFVLGRIFEAAQENALKDMFAANGSLTTKEYQVMLAKSRYSHANCSILGRK